MVINPASPKSGLERLETVLKEAFAVRGGSYRVFETPAEDAGDAIEREIVKARADGANLVIAGGGDGTVSLVADRLAALPRGAPAGNGQAPALLLGIVPLGTANVLARELVIPLDLETAVAVALERRRIVELDAIEVNDRRFLTQVGVGLDARMIEETSREAQLKLGRLAYLISLARKSRQHKPTRFLIRIDGRRPIRLRAWQVIVANAGTFGAQPFTWGPDIDPTDGTLDLCVYDVQSVSDTLRLLWRALTNNHRSDGNARFFTVYKEVRIESSQPLPVQGDGDVIGETPVALRLRKGAVCVVVPEAVQDVAAAEQVKEVPGRPLAAAPGEGTRRGAARARANPERQRVLARIAQHVLMHRVTTFGAVDAALFLKVNGMPGSPLLDKIMIAVSRAMDLGEGWVVLTLIANWARPELPRSMPMLVAGSLWLTLLTVNFPLKAIFRRQRPFIAYIKTRVVGRRPADSSFPSGHTAAAFAGATLLTPYFPSLAPLFYGYAFLVAFSRLYLGVHYPSDVTIGALAGAIFAAIYRVVLGAIVRG